MRVTLRQLEYFKAIVDAGSLSLAGERLNVTPTSLSLQIKQLEDRLGTRLLHRHSRGVVATERGAFLYDRATEILRLVDETEGLFSAGGTQQARTLRIGVTPAVARMVGVEAMTGVMRQCRGATLMLTEGWTEDMMPKLANGTLDFVIAYDLVPQGDIQTVNFREEEFLFVCRPGLFPEGATVALESAVASGLVFYGQRSVGWRAIVDAANAGAVEFHGGLEVQSIEVWRAMLCRGMGTAVAPLATVAEEVRHGDLAAHRLAGAPIVRKIGMAALKDTFAYGREIGFVDFIAALVWQAEAAFDVAGQGRGPAPRAKRVQVPPRGTA